MNQNVLIHVYFTVVKSPTYKRLLQSELHTLKVQVSCLPQYILKFRNNFERLRVLNSKGVLSILMLSVKPLVWVLPTVLFVAVAKRGV